MPGIVIALASNGASRRYQGTPVPAAIEQQVASLTPSMESYSQAKIARTTHSVEIQAL